MKIIKNVPFIWICSLLTIFIACASGRDTFRPLVMGSISFTDEIVTVGDKSLGQKIKPQMEVR
jgi:hypothetical protein